MEITRQSKERESSERRAVTSRKLVREGCPAVVTSEQSPEGDEGLPLSSLGQSVPSRGNSKRKRPEARVCLEN